MNECFLSVSMDLSRIMTALLRLEKFNLTTLMSSFISLGFCPGKKGFFDFNSMIHLTQTPL